MFFTPHTAEDIRQMLESTGCASLDELFTEVPQNLRLQGELNLPAPVSEAQILKELRAMAASNATADSYSSFLGGGAYRHFIPAAVDYLAGRGEFVTAYTPYQAEISQGTLQAIFEFQTMICQLTGMDAANASMYDGASATAEAALMAVRLTRRKKVVLSAGLHPDYRETVRTYCHAAGIETVMAPLDASSRTDGTALGALLGESAAVIIASPNFLGAVEDWAALMPIIREASGVKCIATVPEALSLALFKPPGAFGADMVVGDVQSFGLPLAFGGPHCGFFSVRKQDVRAMPGRLVGLTEDREGKRGFVLTLATREQHIRREKATSNICSNHGLGALMATIYLSLAGKNGLRQIAMQNYSKACYAKEKIAALKGYALPFTAPTFNEFVVEGPEPTATLLHFLETRHILGGIALTDASCGGNDRRWLLCVTEQNSREEIDSLIAALAERSKEK